MADVSLTSMTPDQLRLEVDRLQRELDQTSSEKIQSAQYGLVLLEEKEQLEIRCEELETLYDTTKNELEVTQEALAKFQSNQQVGYMNDVYLIEISDKNFTLINSDEIGHQFMHIIGVNPDWNRA